MVARAAAYRLMFKECDVDRLYGQGRMSFPDE